MNKYIARKIQTSSTEIGGTKTWRDTGVHKKKFTGNTSTHLETKLNWVESNVQNQPHPKGGGTLEKTGGCGGEAAWWILGGMECKNEISENRQGRI